MITFNNWEIACPDHFLAHQHDNLSHQIRVVGEVPVDYTWEALLQVEWNFDILPMQFDADGLYCDLTAGHLATEGHYQLQLRGTRGEEVKHTNQIRVYVPGSLSGDTAWPEIPSAFKKYEARLNDAADKAEQAVEDVRDGLEKISESQAAAEEAAAAADRRATDAFYYMGESNQLLQGTAELKHQADASASNAKAYADGGDIVVPNPEGGFKVLETVPGVKGYMEQAEHHAAEARVSEHNAEVYAEGGTPQGHAGEVVLQGEIPGAKGYMEQAQQSAQAAASSETRADDAARQAANYRSSAGSSATRAERAADEAAEHAAEAEGHADTASKQATWAGQYNMQADASAAAAAESAAAASGSASDASNSALSAMQSAEAAAKNAESVNADEIRTQISAKADNLEFDSETSLLWLLSNGERIGDGIKVATSGGGGTGESNNATLTLKNTTGWTYKSISYGASCPVSFEWSSIEEGLETGAGTLRITVGTTLKHTSQIQQGAHPIDIGPYLPAGSSTVKINITDVYGNSRSIVFNMTVVELVMSSNFDPNQVYTGVIRFPYTATAVAEKTVYFKVDGSELSPVTVTASGVELYYDIPAQLHGCHQIETWFEATVDGETVSSNHLYYSAVCVEAGNNKPIIAVDWRRASVSQYETLAIQYRVYDPAHLTASVSLHSSETGETKPLTVDRTPQIWSYRPTTEGALTLTLSCVGADTTAPADVVMLSMTVTKTDIPVNAETANMSLYLTSYGRSNNEENPAVWSYGNVAARLTNFNFTSDGWLEDEDGVTVLRVGGDARVEIPVQIFAEDFRTTGKTIEIEFASRSVLDYDAVVATCWAADRGFQITAQQAVLKSEKSETVTRYKEDDHLRLSFVIEKLSGNRLIIGYVNGIISGMMQYPDNDDFSQAKPVTITLGSNDCTLDVYTIRVYDNDLNRFQVLNNWIADTQDLSEKADRYDRNSVLDKSYRILPDTLKSKQCYLLLDCPVLPTYKGDTKTCSGSYVDPVNPNRSFTFTGAEIDVQGTSSQFYYVKNFKIKFKGGFKMPNGKTEAVYAMNAQSVPTNEFTFKADVASSEGANNVVLAELYNDLCPVKTPAQEADPRVRQCIEGHPIVAFHDDGSGPKFLGKYNFNNDKGTAEVFGFTTGDESWEIKENGNALVSFKSSDFTNWEGSFEGRYPDKNKDITRLQQFVAWVASTNTEGLTGDERAAKLAKFKSEIGNWADVEDAIFYYLFTLIFLCIDQREKNAFPTYNAEMGKWIWLFYDADSSLGTDNKGNLTFEYWMEDVDETPAGDPVFNGQNNVFWSNLRECFATEIRDEYRRLRTELGSDGKALLSYDKVNELFTAHQSQWSEAIFNEDAWRKAVEPLVKIGDTQYLPMQQGKKEQHFKHWMYNRFRYLDSKFETGAALDEENRIMMRAHAQGNISLTSYISLYGQVYYNSQPAVKRMLNRDTPYEFEWKAQGAEDAVIGVNSAPMITSLGDLSPLMLEYCHIQYAKHLTELKVGDAGEDSPYENDNFVALTLGNNTLLRKLDVRNCTALTQAVDASGCTNIEEVYFDGTKIVGLSLPNGGILKKLHLPATITDLTLRNQPKLSEFVLPGYGNITTLRLENVPECVPGWDILHAIPEDSRVRMVGFDWTCDDAEAVLTLYDRLDTMRGLDENGITLGKGHAQLQGVIRIDALTGAQLAEMQRRYPSIEIVYQHITSNLYFYNDDGSKLLYTCVCADGADGSYGGSAPTKTSTAQYTYAFANGWSLTPNGTANANALKAVTADRNVYAVFTATVRKYTVTWKNGSTTLETDTNVPYGTVPTYNGSTPAYTGSGDAADYEFSGWSPAIGPITGNTTYTAAFRYNGYVYTTLLDGSISGEYVNATVETVGANSFGSYYGDMKVTSVRFTAAKTVGGNAFEYCSALERADFAVLESIGSMAFKDCTRLATLILQGPTVCSLGSDALYRTKIASGTGYIYVPAGLIEEYKAAANWASFASKFRAIEDYPEVWDPYSWLSVNYHIEQGDYATFYKIGDEIPLDLGSEGRINMQVAAFDTDDLADGSGTAPMTLIAKELLKTKKRMNPSLSGTTEGTGAIGGWEKCELRIYLNDTIKPLIPANAASLIKAVTKIQSSYDSTGTAVSSTTEDDVWIPGAYEVGAVSSSSRTHLYPQLFPSGVTAPRIKCINSVASTWWTRDTSSTSKFRYVGTGGTASTGTCSGSYGVCLCFCVGKKEG